MTYVQAITPNPNIPCKPGWCLQYVRQTFGLPAIHPTATAAWYAGTQHRDRDFPPGVWVPVWYALANEPAGHVVLMAPDGSVYSTSDLGNKPHHHPDLADLEAYYRRYGMTLTYRGWTEDVQGIPVITRGGLAAQGTITALEEDELSAQDVEALQQIDNENADRVILETRAQIRALGDELAKALKDSTYELKLWDQSTDNATGDRIIDSLRADIGAMAPSTIASLIPANIAQAVADELSKRLVK